MKRDVIFSRTQARVQPIGPAPVLSSAHLNWEGVLLEEHRLASFEPGEVVWLKDTVLIHLAGPMVLTKSGAEPTARCVLPGRVSIFPAQAVSEHASAEPVEFLMVCLDATLLALARNELAEAEQPRLQAQYGIEDPFVTRVCLALKKEVEQNGVSGRIYSESLARCLSVHLARRYAAGRGVPGRRAAEGGLSPQAMRRVIEYISGQLCEDFSVTEIASEMRLSPGHFAKLFKQSMGVPPYQYALNRRIELAQQLMLEGKLSLAQIALDVGFYDQAHFTRHFKRVNRITPIEFLRQVRAGNLPELQRSSLRSN